MLSKPDENTVVPEETSRLAHVVCPENDRCFLLHEEMSGVFTDRLFDDLFPHRGQPAVPPWQLALITILQFMEGLSDRQAMHAVRTRIDGKYLLRLPLEDQGFDYSVLSEFRTRLVAGQAEARLFEAVLSRAQQRGWVKARGKQRTDSTHVLAAVETLSR
jgi:transposase